MTPVVVLCGWPSSQPDVSTVNGVVVVREKVLRTWFVDQLAATTVTLEADQQALAVHKVCEQSRWHRERSDSVAASEFVTEGPLG